MLVVYWTNNFLHEHLNANACRFIQNWQSMITSNRHLDLSSTGSGVVTFQHGVILMLFNELTLTFIWKINLLLRCEIVGW